MNAKRTVGGKATPTYTSWVGMMRRCYKEKDAAYKRYGGRGISVYSKWHTFDGFAKDMGEKPVGTILDRINYNGNYEPKNCRWATFEEQAGNQSGSRFLEHGGLRMTVTAWSRYIGVSRVTIYKRLNRGLPIERVLAPRRDM